MADFFYDVDNGNGKDFTTISAAVTQLEFDEGVTAFTLNRVIRVFETGSGDYTETVNPANTLLPTATNRFNIIGQPDGGGVFPKWERGTINKNLVMNISNFTISTMEVQKSTTGTGIAFHIGNVGSPAGGIIEDCDMHGNDGSASPRLVFISSNCTDITVRNNTFSKSQRNNVVDLDGDTCKIFNNRFFDTQGMVFLSNAGADDNEISFNSGLLNAGGDGIFVNLATITGTKIKNNIISGGAYSIRAHTDAAGFDSNFNCVHNAATADFRQENGGNDKTLAQWQTDTGFDLNSIGVDPEYLNTTAGSEDLHLGNGSPCIAAGVTISGITTDHDGETRKSTPDMGYDEILKAIYTVKSDASGDFTTINGAIAQVETDEGTTDFVIPRTIQIFELGADYTDIAIPATTLKPTATNLFTFLGIDGSSNEPRWVRGTSGTNLKLGVSNFIIDNIEFENDSGTSQACLSIGESATASNGIIKNCILHGLDDDTLTILIRLFGSFSSSITVNNNILHTSNTDFLRIESANNKAFNNVFFNSRGFCLELITATADNNEISFNSLLGRAGNLAAGIDINTSGATGNKIKNNIVSGFKNNYAIHRTAAGLEFDFNCTHNPITSDYRDYVTSTNFNFADWVALGGGISQNDINADPLFVNTTGGSEDLRITEGSPCIAAGVTISGITTDFEGNTRPTPPAIGKSEFLTVFYDVGPGKTHATLASAEALVLTDEGTSEFIATRKIRIFDDTFTVGANPDSSLTPNSLHRLFYQGAPGNFPLFNLGGSIGFDFNNVPFWTIDNLEINKSGTGSAIQASNSSADGIITACDLGASGLSNLIALTSSSDRTVIFKNIMRDSTSVTGAIAIQTADNKIFNNQVFGVRAGIVLTVDTAVNNAISFNSLFSRTALGPGISQIGIGANNKFKNNIAVGFATGISINSNATGFESDNNCTNGNTNAYFDLDTSTSFTLSEFQTAFPSLDQNSIAADPIFDNTGAGTEDLHIGNASPCRSAGVAITGITDDFDGDARDATAPEIGMDEVVFTPAFGSFERGFEQGFERGFS